MGTISSSVGIISGIDTKSLIDQLIAIESRPKQLIQNRSTVLKTTQIAFQEINATLLALKGSAGAFTPSLFSATRSTSSDDSIMSVSSTPSAAPGSYSFTVNRLVSGQQTVSKGLLDTNFTKLAPQGATLTFDRGEARLTSETQLATLNGGAGIKRGYMRITDRSGASAIVDLRSVVSVNDVIDKLNQATGVNIFAEIDGDAIRVNDLSGGTGNFTIADVGGNGTATSLGLAASVAAAEIAGANVNTIGRDSLLTTLNDGNGVRYRAGIEDFRITTAGGGSFNFDIESVRTVGELIDLINTTTGGNVTATVGADGASIQLTDNTGGGPGFAVTAINGSNAAVDLGLVGSDADGDGTITGGRVLASINSKLLKNLNGGEGVAGLAGSSQVTLLGSTSLADLFGGTGLAGDGTGAADLRITTRIGAAVEIDLDAVAGGTVQDLINLINGASPNLQASIDGQALRITDISGGASNLKIESINGSNAAMKLGIAVDAAKNQVTTANLRPSGAASASAVIRVTNRAGDATDIDLAGAQTIEDIIRAINDSGAGVTASVNNSGMGIQLTDNTAGTGLLSVSDVAGTAAASLRLAKSSSTGSTTLDSGSLQYRYIFESTRLDAMGVTRGKFTITDSSGAKATVDLTQGNEITISDVISEINSRGIAITARINDTGDGILLQDTGLGTFAIKVEEDGSTTAADLGLLGTAAAPGQNLDGSFEKTVSLTGDDTLETAILKINEAKVGVLAAVINDGSPGAPYRLSLQARTEGTRGAFAFDDGGVGLNATNVNEAQDAVVFFGSADPAKALQITAKTNTIQNVVPGVTVTLKRVSDVPVTVTVNRDDDGLIGAAQTFVANFNKVIASINKHDSYDSETNRRGLLLGDPTVTTTKNRLYAMVTNRNADLTGQFTALSQLGIRVGKDSVLEFDADKFRQALETDRDAVQAVFSFKETAKDADGNTRVARAGVGVRIDEYLARLTDSIDGVFKSRVDTLGGQIKINDRRIADIDKVLESKRARLEQQFLAMERALAQMQGQGSSLNSLQTLATQARNGFRSNNNS
jgi:flagellar hook-associated protein 2